MGVKYLIAPAEVNTVRPQGYRYPIGLSLITINVATNTIGGTQIMDGDNAVHTFTSTDDFIPSFTGNVEVLIVAGGGGSCGSYPTNASGAGGGGAGGLVYHSAFPVISSTSYTSTVGAGGAAKVSGPPVYGPDGLGNPGSNSKFGLAATAYGGGGGGFYQAGLPGGSGGGGGFDVEPGGTATSTPASMPEADLAGGIAAGNNGGSGFGAQCGGGGGGAGEIGGTGTPVSTLLNTGGDGLEYSISGSATYYAGGGAGGASYVNAVPTAPLGGNGGGGNGAWLANPVATPTNRNPAISGTANRGGGGGGGLNELAAGSGGSGVVIVRYQTEKQTYLIE